MTDRPAPYPADTRAKGWRFELDYERIEQSDTWDIAAEVPMAQPALLMMWLVAWRQEPCGSLPSDEGTIRAKCRIPVAVWAKVRVVLMRGWWLADDGRLYHKTLSARVLEMLEYRAATSKRVAKHKEAKRLEHAGNTLPPRCTTVKNDTGTGTGTGSKEDGGVASAAYTGAGTGEYDPETVIQGQYPTRYGAISKALRLAGIGNAQPSLMRFRLLVDAGAEASEFLGFVEKALAINGDRFAYIVGAVEGERKRALATAGQIHRGPMPNKQEAIEQRNRAVADAWATEGTA